MSSGETQSNSNTTCIFFRPMPRALLSVPLMACRPIPRWGLPVDGARVEARDRDVSDGGGAAVPFVEFIDDGVTGAVTRTITCISGNIPCQKKGLHRWNKIRPLKTWVWADVFDRRTDPVRVWPTQRMTSTVGLCAQCFAVCLLNKIHAARAGFVTSGHCGHFSR